MSLALLCPGQGGQHSAMFDLVAGHEHADAVLDLARRVLPAAPRDLVTGGADIYCNHIAQPLVCAAILARWEALRDTLPAPAMVLGYSVGELAAHAIAGTFDSATCLRLAARRAELMDAASPAGSGLVAVLGLNQERIKILCAAHGTAIAIANGPAHVVLGGSGTALEAVAQAAAAQGARTQRLRVCVPAHTPLLTDAAAAFADELARTPLRSPAIPVLAGIDGRAVLSAADAAATLAAQIARTVDWRQCLTQARERGATVLLELGPGSALARIARELYPDCAVRSLDEFRSLDGARAWVERTLDPG